MARTQIRAEQVQDLVIKNLQIATDAGIELSKLEEAVIQADGGQAFTGDQSMGGNKLTSVATPTADNDAVNKAYADSIASGLDVKASVRVATTANITLSGEQTIDGIAVVDGDRVLVKNQTAEEDNGIYVCSTGSWVRSDDANSDAEVNAGMFTFIEEGTANADSGWVLATDNPITVGTTELEFVKFSSAGEILAGDGLTKTGSTIDVGAGDGITVNADSIEINLDGTTLTVGGSGLKVASGGITETEINSSALGDGIAGGSGTVLSVDIASNGGLEFSGGELKVKLKSGGGIAVDGDGLYLDGASETRVVRETPTGTVNGSNQDFDLAHTPVSGSEMIFYNGILMNEGATEDYTISGTTITLADAPKTKDVILVTYWY